MPMINLSHYHSSGLFRVLSVVTVATLVPLAMYANDAQFIPLGDLPGGGFSSGAIAVSDDGRIVVGLSDAGNERTSGFRWSPGSGIQKFGDNSSNELIFRPREMSPDGQYIVGSIRSSLAEYPTAFIWSSADGFLELTNIKNQPYSIAQSVSADGRVVVGTTASADFDVVRSFRWTMQTGMQLIPLLRSGDRFSEEAVISSNGVVVADVSSAGGLDREAFKWTQTDGTMGLGFLSDSVGESVPQGISADGSIIVGFSNNGAEREAFRWSQNEGMVGLGIPSGAERSIASVVSSSGHVIAGSTSIPDFSSITGLANRAMVWTENTGILDLREYLVSNGAQGLNDWVLKSVADISGDGRWVVGQGMNPDGNDEAFLARLASDLIAGALINAGLNDAWFNPVTRGQGFFIQVFPAFQIVSIAWFTYDTELPPDSIDAVIGDPGQRWFTAAGTYEGNTATLELSNTSGGTFDSGEPMPGTVPYGELKLTVEDCESATIEYDLPGQGLSGVIPIQRVAGDPELVALCEALAE